MSLAGGRVETNKGGSVHTIRVNIYNSELLARGCYRCYKNLYGFKRHCLSLWRGNPSRVFNVK